MEIKGRIVQILPLVSGVSANGEWKKQDYILETDDQYPKKICFNCWGDKIQQFNIQQGEELIASIDVSSREFNGRWYTEVRAWKIDRPSAQPAQSQDMGAAPFPPQDYFAPQTNAGAASNDDLPF